MLHVNVRGGVSASLAPEITASPAPPASLPFLQNKHPRAQTTHPAKAQMEPDLELINPVAWATGIQSSLSSPPPACQAPPLPARPRPFLSWPPPLKALAPPSPPPAAGGTLVSLETLPKSRMERVGISKNWVQEPTQPLLAWWERGQGPEPLGTML